MGKNNKARRKAKQAQRGKSHRPSSAPVARLADAVDEINDLVQAGDLDEAESRLARLPQDAVPVLGARLDVALDRGDMYKYALIAEKLTARLPQDADYAFALAGAYLQCQSPFLARDAFRRALERFPAHRMAAEGARTVAKLDGAIQAIVQAMPAPLPNEEHLLAVNDRVIFLMAGGSHAEALALCEQLLREEPRYVAAHNNRAMLLWHLGRPQEALAAAKEAARLSPDNAMCTAGLALLRFVNGDAAGARETLAPLAAITPDQRGFVKVAEVHSLMGNDDEILALAARTPKDATFELRERFELWVGAALARKGDAAGARDRFRAAARHLGDSDKLATRNLEDLDLPPDERQGPATHALPAWIPGAVLLRTLGTGNLEGAGALLRQWPAFRDMAPYVLLLSDERSRGIIAAAALASKDAALLETVKAFVLGEKGTDRSRMDLATELLRAGFIPNGTRMPFWAGGKRVEVLLLEHRITDESSPPPSRSPEVNDLHQRAHERIRARDWPGAEALLRQAVTIEPDSADLVHNLASMIGMQRGRAGEARELLERNHRRHPDYLFSRCAVAEQLLEDGKPEQADAMMAPLRVRTELHVTEFAALSAYDVDRYLQRRQVAKARAVLERWEEIGWEDAKLERARARVEAAEIKERAKAAALDLPRALLRRFGF